MNKRWLAIKQLDRQLKEWQAVSNKFGKPRVGWVKTIRETLSMSIEQLAIRLGVSRSRISQLESAEIQDAVTLRTLRDAAHAMECELVYAIVPKDHTTLENIIKTRVEQVAKERIARVAHTMSLEAQTVDTDILNDQNDSLIKNLAEHLNKKIWVDFTNEENDQDQKNKDHKQSELFKNLIEILQKKK